MTTFDVCFAWNVEEDAQFVRIFSQDLSQKNLTLTEAAPDRLGQIKENLEAGQLSFRTLLDRASDNDARFQFIERWALEHGAYVINRSELTSQAIDKAKMHLEFIKSGLQTPYTIFLTSFDEQTELPPIELSPLGEQFIIKPAHGGGGEGVIVQAHTWEDVLVARQSFRNDMYLLQVFIKARELASREAWFRIIYCSGETFPCWWDTKTHVYSPLTSAEEDQLGLHTLREITMTISQICRLELFSTEVALTAENLFVVVDYVNDQIDLRLQSQAADGIPDEIVAAISKRLTMLIAAKVPVKDEMPSGV